MKTNKITSIFIFFLLIGNSAYSQYRIIITSDFPSFPVTNSDPDDVQSMVRFLLYSNDFNVEGLVNSAGTFDMVVDKKKY